MLWGEAVAKHTSLCVCTALGCICCLQLLLQPGPCFLQRDKRQSRALPPSQGSQGNMWRWAVGDEQQLHEGGFVHMEEDGGTPSTSLGWGWGRSQIRCVRSCSAAESEPRCSGSPQPHDFCSTSCLHEEHSWSKEFPPMFYTAERACFSKYVWFLQVLSLSSAVSFVPLWVSQVPKSCCSFSVPQESPVSLCPRCVVRLRAQKPGLAVEMPASILTPNGKKGLLLQKRAATKKPVLLQAPNREVQVSFGMWRAELPWENTFSVIPASPMFFFQHLFTVNYCFRLYPFLLSFFPRQLLRGTWRLMGHVFIFSSASL